MKDLRKCYCENQEEAISLMKSHNLDRVEFDCSNMPTILVYDNFDKLDELYASAVRLSEDNSEIEVIVKFIDGDEIEYCPCGLAYMSANNVFMAIEKEIKEKYND